MSNVTYTRPRAIQQQRYNDNPYADVLGIIGTIMGQNANQRNEAGKAAVYDRLANGQSTNQGGLISGVMPDTNFAPQYAQQPDQNFGIGQQSQGAQQNTGGLFGMPDTNFAPQYAQQPANNTQSQTNTNIPAPAQTSMTTPATTPAPITAKETDTLWTAPNKVTIGKQFRAGMGDAIKELTQKRGMTAQDAVNSVQGVVDKRTNEVYAEQNTKYVNGLYGTLSTEMNADKPNIGKVARAAGLLKQAGIDVMPEIKQFMVSAGDKLKETGLNTRYGTVGANNQLASDTSIQTTGMNNNTSRDVAAGNNATTIQAAGIRAEAANNSPNTQKYINVPGLGSITLDQAMTQYNKALGKDQTTKDAYGQTVTVKGEPNEDIVNMLGPILKGATGGNVQPPQKPQQSGAEWYDSRYRELIGKGFTPDQATQRMTALSGG